MASEEEKADEAAAEELKAKHGRGLSLGDLIPVAAGRGNVRALRHLLRVAPGSVDEKGFAGQTPLHFAAWNGRIEAAELLLSKGAEVDATNNDGKTPLDLAREGRKAKMEEFLLNFQDAAPHAAGRHQRSTLSSGQSFSNRMASKQEEADKAAAKELEAEYGVNGIHGAAQLGNLPALRHYLRVDPGSVHEEDDWGETPLHVAAFNGDVEAAELLLSKGAEVDAESAYGKIPLDYAWEGGKTEMERFLLNWPAKKPSADDGKMPPDLSNKGKAEMKPLSTAADTTSKAGKKAQQTPGFAFQSSPRSTLSSCQLFSNRMASKQEEADAAAAAKCRGGIHQAAERGDLGALRHYLRVDPGSVHEEDDWGQTPLHQAAVNGKVASAELLLSKRAAVDAQNDYGKTPLDLARERGRKKMEQLLLPHAKKPSADDGSDDVDLVVEPRAVAALALESHEAFEVRDDARAKAVRFEDPSSPAGSGAAAAKHQREVSKEEAAKELQEAMDSGDAQVLMNAIDNAKLHKVNQEVVMKAMEKCIALQGAANQGATSPVGKAAKELQEAMDSGDAQVLMNAIDNAKLHKVNQEVVMKAMEKCIALQGAANQSATSPAKEDVSDIRSSFLEAATSKAESSVKLEPGHKARLAMFSARFNEKNKDTEMKFRAVHKLLRENHYEILMVDAGAGKSFGDDTLKYLRRLGEEKGVMLAVCTSDYGEMTDSPFCTYYELKLAKEYNVDVLPLQVEDNWKPCPPCGEGHRDHSKSALDYIHAVFLPSIVRIDCRKKRVEEIASEIAATLRKP